MNPAVEQLYADYLSLTNHDASAAASLALADVFLKQPAPSTTSASGQLPSNRPLTVPELARLLRVRQTKIRNWIRRGDLRAINITEKSGGRAEYRIRPEDLEAFSLLRATQSLPVNRQRPVRRRRLPPVPHYD
jgi:excisionase family DNA binding protein